MTVAAARKRLGRIGSLTVLALLSSGMPVSEAVATKCDGHEVTIMGTADDDTIDGTEEVDVIWGGPGNDVINGRGGNDRLCGGSGNDRLAGGGTSLEDPHDRLFGGRGADTAFFAGAEGSVNAYIYRRGFDGGGVAKAQGVGMNRLFGIENLRGTAYDDSLHGDSGANRLWGREGDDALKGRGGNDRLMGGEGQDTVDGGGGKDHCLDAESTSNCE
ncbi:MAG: calcium-binding protein [Actinomycetota bacterium]